ncbi:MAG: 2-C-methyl-D-erythritol 2,4-cyclodiphosphate synthase [Clostridiales bacterium]|jgi:2-C-methyl-D-erythritol 2,4-cyclodiphosphate synthase/2-C-methyl-D-erythritol 4-phosphate cytidylyltransferase|nr:2-C-methyl-D-erythritol 2,4-cyclodiphosphate synthase [Clostridiales bacterium]
MNKNYYTVGILLAAGRGDRFGLEFNKALYISGCSTVVEKAFDTLQQIVDEVILVVAQKDLKIIKDIFNTKNAHIVVGGDSRFESVKCGLNAIVHNRIFCDIVVVHDCARCNATKELFKKSIDCAIKFGSGIAAIPCIDTVKKVEDGKIVEDLNRNTTYLIQTPQSYKFKELYIAYNKAKYYNFTDDSAVFQHGGHSPHMFLGETNNIKLTYPADTVALNDNFRIGHGFDVHCLASGRKLVLGGINVDYHLGLLGHSDADVLTHSIMDALLSASNLPDIGVLFSDTDAKYKDAVSIDLLQEVLKKITSYKFKILNISAVIIAQQPKLQSIIPLIENKLAQVLKIEKSNIKISATTTEQLGIVGQNKGMAASAMCLLCKY